MIDSCYIMLTLAMHVDDCFKFKRHHMLERYGQQNFVLNTIWLVIIISNAILFFYLKRCFLLVDDTKIVCQRYAMTIRLNEQFVKL